MLLSRLLRQKTYDIKAPGHLIQSVRVYQSLMEAGIKVNISEEQVDTFEYLKQFFPVSYAVNSKASTTLDVSISHEEPFVSLGGHKQPLLFPNTMFNLCKSYWKENRSTDFIFVGLITPERKKILANWDQKLQKVHPGKITIKNSQTGREFPQKAWDDSYYKAMADAKFALCPNGDFIWTYRFFEAALCGAIPVIQNPCELYEGFTFYTDKTKGFVWTREIATENYEKALALLGPPKNLKQLLHI